MNILLVIIAASTSVITFFILLYAAKSEIKNANETIENMLQQHDLLLKSQQSTINYLTSQNAHFVDADKLFSTHDNRHKNSVEVHSLRGKINPTGSVIVTLSSGEQDIIEGRCSSIYTRYYPEHIVSALPDDHSIAAVSVHNAE
jgi:Tfp pilus assembly protein PilN